MTRDGSPAGHLTALVVACAVALALLAFRTHDLAGGYVLLGEQVRDWGIAQRHFADLPLLGPASPNSGLEIGPVYYWVLWAGRVLVEPIAGPLPHTGGLVIALVQSVADAVLLAALWRCFGSLWLAAGVVASSRQLLSTPR